MKRYDRALEALWALIMLNLCREDGRDEGEDSEIVDTLARVLKVAEDEKLEERLAAIMGVNAKTAVDIALERFVDQSEPAPMVEQQPGHFVDLRTRLCRHVVESRRLPEGSSVRVFGIIDSVIGEMLQEDWDRVLGQVLIDLEQEGVEAWEATIDNKWRVIEIEVVDKGPWET